MFIIRSTEPLNKRFRSDADHTNKHILWIGKDADSGGYPYATEYEAQAAKFDKAEDAFDYLLRMGSTIDDDIDKYAVYQVEYKLVEKTGVPYELPADPLARFRQNA
jgi:hypothetical protein